MRVGDRGRQPRVSASAGCEREVHRHRHRLPQPELSVLAQPPGGAWSVVQAYSSSNIWTWNTTGLAAGTYTLDVYARDASSTAGYDAHISPNPTYTLQAAVTRCASVTEAASPRLRKRRARA